MNIDGYAFKSDAKERQQKMRKRLDEINHIYKKGELEFSVTPDYKRTHFSGTLHTDRAKELSEEDIFIIVSSAHNPFGGFISKNGNSFKGDIYND
jgi:hypothetical protein